MFVQCKLPNVYRIVTGGRQGIWINLSLSLHLLACQPLRLPMSALFTHVVRSTNIWSSLTCILGWVGGWVRACVCVLTPISINRYSGDVDKLPVLAHLGMTKSINGEINLPHRCNHVTRSWKLASAMVTNNTVIPSLQASCEYYVTHLKSMLLAFLVVEICFDILLFMISAKAFIVGAKEGGEG